jgi:hypothetical protein
VKRLALVLVAASAIGCAAGESAPAAAAADLPFGVNVTSMYVEVMNRSTRPLTGIRVTVVPAGPLRFTSSYSRIEAQGRRVFNIGDFRAHDNSPLNLRIVKPRSVVVEVTDPDGKPLRLEVPWKR